MSVLIVDDNETTIAAMANALGDAGNDVFAGDSEQSLQQFVDRVSHEFRTPLTVIKGYAEALIQQMAGPINPQQNEFLGYVADRAGDLARILDDLLDSSQLRSGTMRIDRGPQQVEKILAAIRPMLRAKASANKVELIEQISPRLPEVFADAEKVARVLSNLAVHAIRSSQENGCVIIWAAEDDDGGVKIGVNDSGTGIAPANLRLIGAQFNKIGHPHNAAIKGFDLGLHIARELTALNLGEIDVDSEVGHGSTFCFTLAPNRVENILQRYLRYLTMRPNVADTIAMLRISPGDAELRRFSASVIGAADLLLDSPRGDSLLVIGCSAHPLRWADRLREHLATRADSVHVELVEQWSTSRRDLEKTVLSQLKGEKCTTDTPARS